MVSTRASGPPTTDRGRRVASKIKCGTVNVNEGFAATFGSIDAPMGGMKNSGLGRRQGATVSDGFVDVQSVATQVGIPIAPEPRPRWKVLHLSDDRRTAGDEEDRQSVGPLRAANTTARIDIPLTQHELASLIALARQSRYLTATP